VRPAAAVHARDHRVDVHGSHGSPTGHHNGRVRVVAGSLRGRRLVAPEGRDTRPTGDRVREAVFNALGSLDAVDDARVVDLFAGSGALGIEALSRGARHCVFIDHDRRAREAVRSNLRALGLEDRAQVVAADARAHLEATGERFDLALADPPYRYDAWPELLTALDAEWLVAESDRVIEVPAPWSTVRQKRYGSTVVLIARREAGQARGVAAPGEPESTHPPGSTHPSE
jgi:16S rRNA (guanine966-N2)-methyltransferase